MKLNHLSVIGLALCCAGPVPAQSNVQCSMNTDGVFEAALVWRNTLGAERANALCRTATAGRIQDLADGDHAAPAPASYRPLYPQESHNGKPEEYVPLFQR
ncbi:hypothetical protein [Verminephrobacter eiseniae]|uniref:hypothetical protein n=1 Tax=Verminephrobacter eiseniae TaxID=364317 RepID=UPI0002F77DDA|nr:hypothetical protein [Verminephrobacter eiseniae]MCW5284946.1 hypothetical protein [Verminephrobacter eiseniae]MCW5302654.1 hypothetical protein [Verminephrobacter eiseniae]MCW8180261.1 hypothetical protein [Verminephrobacter eiseniae]MCW8189017.1 hypothetical protein [Verminephrobacter eiseniae]